MSIASENGWDKCPTSQLIRYVRLDGTIFYETLQAIDTNKYNDIVKCVSTGNWSGNWEVRTSYIIPDCYFK